MPTQKWNHRGVTESRFGARRVTRTSRRRSCIRERDRSDLITKGSRWGSRVLRRAIDWAEATVLPSGSQKMVGAKKPLSNKVVTRSELCKKAVTREEMPERMGDVLETDTDHIRSPTLPQEDDDGLDSTQATEDISEPSSQQSQGLKRKRGATKMKNIALDMESRVDVEWTEGGEPIGKGSVSLSSFLGPLVREIVPITLVDWRKRSSDISHILWKTIQARYKVDQEWQKDYIFRAMGCLFRSSKSTLVHRIRQAPNEEERMKIRPGNIKKVEHWRQFVRLKTSAKFKAISDKYKAMRSEQIPHTCSRKGMVRLTVDMKKKSTNPASISRVKVWIKSRTRKDGKPVNKKAGQTIEKLEKIESASSSSSTSSVKEDALSQVLGQDAMGRLKGMGRGMTHTKLALIQSRNKHVAQLQETQIQMAQKITALESLVKSYMNTQSYPLDKQANFSSPLNVDTNEKKCKLLDWTGSGDIVAEGRWHSSDPKVLVNHMPLGPNAIKVLVDISREPEAHLWRPTAEMITIEEAIGNIVAWPADKVIMNTSQKSGEHENVSSPSVVCYSEKTDSNNKCKLKDWFGSGETVAEGRWSSNDPKSLVNHIPLGPSAVRVWVDLVKKAEAFLWRPTSDMIYIKDAIGSTIAWPIDKVIMSTSKENEEHDTISSPTSVNTSSNNKCKLLDWSGSKEVVAEGRWFSNDPKKLVHSIPLGPNAISVWVDIAKKPEASLWRPSSEMNCIEEAIRSIVAWPADKVIMS